MKETLETDKEIIERLTNKILSLEEQLSDENKYKVLYQDLIVKYKALEDKIEKQSILLDKYEKSEKIQKYTDSFLNKFNFKTPEELEQFIINNLNKSSISNTIENPLYISLKKENEELKKSIQELKSKDDSNKINIDMESIEKNIEEKLNKKYENIFKQKINDLENYNKKLINDNKELLEKINTGIPSPSTSEEIKNIKVRKTKDNKNKKNNLLCSNCNKEEIDKNNNKEKCINCFTLDIHEKIKNKLSFEKVDKSIKGHEAINALINKNYRNMEIYFDIHKKAMVAELDTIEYNDLIHDIIKKNKDETSITRLKNKIKRSSTLLQEFGDKLQYINISTKYLGYMTKIEFNVLYNYLKDLFNEGNNNKNQNDALDYPCKNESCNDYVIAENTFCEDCSPYVRVCIECEEEFSDEFTNCKKCLDCRSESDEENEVE